MTHTCFAFSWSQPVRNWFCCLMLAGTLLVPGVARSDEIHPYAGFLPDNPIAVLSLRDTGKLLASLQNSQLWADPQISEALQLLQSDQGGPLPVSTAEKLADSLELINHALSEGRLGPDLSIAIYSNEGGVDVVIIGSTTGDSKDLCEFLDRFFGSLQVFADCWIDSAGDTAQENPGELRSLPGSARESPEGLAWLSGPDPSSEVRLESGIGVRVWQPTLRGESWGPGWHWFVHDGIIVFANHAQRLDSVCRMIADPGQRKGLEHNRRFLTVQSRLNAVSGGHGGISLFLVPELLRLIGSAYPEEVWRAAGIHEVLGVGLEAGFQDVEDATGETREDLFLNAIGVLSAPRSGFWKAMEGASSPTIPPMATEQLTYLQAISLPWDRIFDEFALQYERLYGSEAWEEALQQAKGPMRDLDPRQDLLGALDGSIGSLIAGPAETARYNSSLFYRFQSPTAAENYLRIEISSGYDSRERPYEESDFHGYRVWQQSDAALTELHSSRSNQNAGKAPLSETLQQRPMWIIVDNWLIRGNKANLEADLVRLDSAGAEKSSSSEDGRSLPPWMDERVQVLVKDAASSDYRPFGIIYYGRDGLASFWSTRLHRFGFRSRLSLPEKVEDRRKLSSAERTEIAARLAIAAFQNNFGDFLMVASQNPACLRVGACLRTIPAPPPK